MIIGFFGRIIEGVGAGLLQTAGIYYKVIFKKWFLAYGEVIAQNKDD